MRRMPEPQQTPQGPVYEGRLLDRADEEVVDQGAPFDIRTLITRRGVLSLVGIGVGAAALAACTPNATGAGTPGTLAPSATADPGASATSGTGTLPASEIPDETAGPYPGDGSNGPDVLEQSGIVRSDIRSSLDGGITAAGVPLTLNLTILDTANGDVPFQDVAVYAWHCDAQGGYSMYSQGIEDQTYLRGVQVADADGRVSVTSIFPGCYTGRWPHIHFEVYPTVSAITDSSTAIATSQVALPEDVSSAVYALAEYRGSSANLSRITLSSDNVFGEDAGVLQLATVSGDATAGYTAALTVRVDTRTAPTGGSAPGGGGPGGGPGGPGGGRP